ncbi:15-hydroxyprostaglandin dehydrogenase [Trichonephila clavipes]|nr:15-hydroxyprostaglandin dehydrogenase [Trichonephila clavipes]
MPPHGPGLSLLDTVCCPEAHAPRNLEQPTIDYVQSDTMASAVLADPIRALQGTNRESGPAMEESENDVGSLEQLFLYADEHYLARKLPLGEHLGKVLHEVQEYNQRNVGPLRFHASQLKWTGYHRLWPSDHYTSWSAWKGRLDLRFASARCLEIVRGTIATPTSPRIVEQVTVGSTSACLTILRSSLLVVFLVAPDPVSTRGYLLMSTAPKISNGTLRTIHLASNTARRPA